MSTPQSAHKKAADGYSKIDILKIKLNTELNLKAIFSEKDRIFTDFQLSISQDSNLKNYNDMKHHCLILCDRSGRIYFMHPKNLYIIHEPLKGYRDVQICLSQMSEPGDEPEWSHVINKLIAFLPKRNITQSILIDKSMNQLNSVL